MVRLVGGMCVVAALVFTGCSSSQSSSGSIAPETLDAAQARWPDATVESLEHGRAIFTESCHKCHPQPVPEKYGEDRWPAILKVMAPRAKLLPEQAELVQRYLIAESVAKSGS